MVATLHSSPLTSDAVSSLEEYVAQLLKWNAKINLISATTTEDIWNRHVEDSLQLIPLLPAPAKNIVDLGSGAGFPGMVLAITQPEISVTLVEKDQRKSAFLNEVKSRLKLDNLSVVTADIAEHRAQYDVVTARALASLDQLLAFASPLLSPSGVAIFLKGEQHAQEIADAEKTWVFDCARTPSRTHPTSAILFITHLARKR